MNSYLYTLAFLTLMSFLTSSEVIRFSANTLEKKCYHDSREALVVAEELRELTHLAKLRIDNQETPKEKKKVDETMKKSRNYIPRAKALGVDAACPPDNSRLNFYILFYKKPPADLPKEFTLYEVMARLMRTLYKEELFSEIPNAEYKILDKLIEKKEECRNFAYPDQLAEIDLEDEKLQQIFYQMLTGTSNAAPFLHYITFTKPGGKKETAQDRKINLLFADRLILEAIFPEGQTAELLLAKRDQIWDQIVEQEEHRLERRSEDCLNRSQFATLLKVGVEEILAREGFKASKYSSQVFDYKLEERGTIIFLQDPTTGKLRREKYIPQKTVSKAKSSS